MLKKPSTNSKLEVGSEIMKVGQRFYVSDYYLHQDDKLIQFEIVETNEKGFGWPEWVKYKAVRLGEEKGRQHYFGDRSSPDVWSARVLQTKWQVLKFRTSRFIRRCRRSLAELIYPEMRH